MNLVLALLVLALIVVIAFYIVDKLPLPGDIKWIVQLILGVLFLIYLLNLLFPQLLGSSLRLGAIPLWIG